MALVGNRCWKIFKSKNMDIFKRKWMLLAFVLFIYLSTCNAVDESNLGNKDIAVKEEKVVGKARIRSPDNRKKAEEAEENKGKAAKSPKDPKDKGYKLANDEACMTDVHELCQHVKRDNNFAVLTCLQDAAVQSSNPLSQDCHQQLWSYKSQLTKDTRFDEAAKNLCGKALEKHSECGPDAKLEPGGDLVNCLIENKDTIDDARCRQFITKMASVVFSDYRLIKGFHDECKHDVEKFGCGIIANQDETDLHSQAHVISCLEEHLKKVQKSCQTQIFRVAELSSDDYHMDRSLFYACQDSRERLCSKVQSGNGQVYKCLLDHKGDNAMAPQCKDSLLLREQLMVEDVKVNHALWSSCKEDYSKHNCQKGDTEHGKAAHLLICLSEAAANGKTIAPMCLSEMQEFGIRLFEEYKLSPELVSACEHQLDNECKVHVHEDNGPLNCLMTLGSEGKLNDQCYLAVNEILKETNAGNDYKIDRPLYLACEPIVQTVCKGKPSSMILGCLMDQMHSKEMVPTCRDQLFHLQYFLARDFRLDRELFLSCKDDAKKHCHAPAFQEENSSMPHGVVLSCLYRSSLSSVPHNEQISEDCSAHIQRVMHQRAVSAKLIPPVDEACKKDLGQHCSDKHGPGEEITCLQERFDSLEIKCQEAISNFTELEAEDTNLDRALIDTCAPMVVKFCQSVITAQNSDAVLPCLIDHKHAPEMDFKCRSSIEHWQLLELKSFKFSHNLKRACMKDINMHCQNVKSKLEAVQCLSGLMHKEAMGGGSIVANDCQVQLRLELIEQTENIKFNPELFDTCQDDIKRFCSGVEFGDGQVEECLRLHVASVSKKCRKVLHKEEVVESKDSELDYNLMKFCRHEIELFCHDQTAETYQTCLIKNMKQTGFSKTCRKIVKQRQVEAARDTSLDPELQENCESDLKRFCSSEGTSSTSEDLTCLKSHSKELSSNCGLVVKARQVEQAKDIDLNVPVEKACHAQIMELCGDAEIHHTTIVECMKKNFRKIKGHECQQKIKAMIAEMQKDLHLDPPLHKACRRDIKVFCEDEDDGEGEVLQCLMDVYKAKKKHLKSECRHFLMERMELWTEVGSPMTFESLSEIAAAVDSSPHRSYLYTVMMCLLAVIFVGGLCFGRITKRVKQEFKDR